MKRIRLRSVAALAMFVALLIGAEQAPAATIVRFDTNLGDFDVELYPQAAPISVANFLNYVTNGSYDNTIVHRTVNNFVIQGGGYSMPNWDAIPNNGPIPLEYNLPNERGTLAMARTSQPNTATTQWFINTVNNTNTLGPNQFGPGYAVFGRVLGDGMDVVDAIAAAPRYNLGFSPFQEVPLLNYVNGAPQPHSVIINSISVVPEPSSLVLGAMGLAAIGCVWRKRRGSR